jgi:hypothetical protein
LRWASVVKADDGSAWVLVSIARGPYDGELERFELVAAKVAAERRAVREAELESASVLEALRAKKPAALRSALRAATTRAAIAAKHLASVVDEPSLFALLLEAVPPHERQAHLDKLLDDDWNRARRRAVDPRTAVRLGANLDAVDPQHRGRTLLSRLSSHEWELRRVRALLAAGADPNLQDEDGMTALHHAQSPKVMKALVEAGAALDVEDQSGATALVEFLRVLALNGAPGRQQPRAPTAEELALARLMIERGAQPSGEALRQLLAPWAKNRKLAAAASALMGVQAQRGKTNPRQKVARAR